MNFQDIPPKEIPTTVLIDRLTEGWRISHAGLPQELVSRWGAALQAQVDVKLAGDNMLTFVSHLDHICLRAMRDVPCWVASGSADLNGEIDEFQHKFKSKDQVAFVLALSGKAYEQVQARVSDKHCVRLTADDVKRLLKSGNPVQLLKEFMWKQLQKGALLPYNINIPAEGGMFFGREGEVSRLTEETQTSFAIAGPGRIGKTSLLRRYKEQSLRSHTQHSDTRFFINLYRETPASTARHLAMNIDPSSRSDRVTADGLINFMRYQRVRHGAPLELLLDEVDGVCHSEAFRSLAEAAKMGLCRLLMCGRGQLLKEMLSPNSPLEGRVELIRIEPLDVEAARGLILKPLKDLGFKIDRPEQLADQILSLTGRLPHSIQNLCKGLALSAIAANSEYITLDHLKKVKGDFLTAQFFIKPLLDLKEEPRTCLIGLRLVAGEERSFTIRDVQEIARQEEVELPLNAALEICNDLVINNVLAWNSGAYTLANEGLPFFAQQIGYLDGALAEARKAVKSR